MRQRKTASRLWSATSVLGSMENDYWTLPHCRACRDAAAQAVDQSRLCCTFRLFAVLISRRRASHGQEPILGHDGDWTDGAVGWNVGKMEIADEALEMAMCSRSRNAARWSLLKGACEWRDGHARPGGWKWKALEASLLHWKQASVEANQGTRHARLAFTCQRGSRATLYLPGGH
jgi:hypothetical protein